jgi:hypothetical protein
VPRQRLATGHADLRLHEVDAHDALGDGVLHLQPRVHLEEVEARVVAVAVEQELDRPGVAVPGGPRRGHGRLAHLRAHRRGQRRAGAFLDGLLVTPLRRALALEQVHDVAVVVGEHLDLDVARPLDEPLHVQRAVAERRRGLAPCRLQGVAQARRVADHLHADPATTGGRLDEHGEADRPGRRGERVVRLIVRRLTGDDRHAGRLHDRARADLRPHALDRVRGRPDEHETGVLDRSGKPRPLGEESVPGMHGVGAARACRLDQRGDAQVALGGRCGAEPHGAVAAVTCGARTSASE